MNQITGSFENTPPQALGGDALANDLINEQLDTIVTALSQQGFCVIPNFLEPDFCLALAAEVRSLHSDGAFRHAGVGRQQDFQVRPEIRSDHVLWLNPEDPSLLQAKYLNQLEILRTRINQTLTLGLFGFESHFALYPAGSFYRRHSDQFMGATHRTVTCISYLNQDWLPKQGGALRIYIPQPDNSESHLDIFPESGSIIVFLSSAFEHEVLPATRERLSLTGWFFRRH